MKFKFVRDHYARLYNEKGEFVTQIKIDFNDNTFYFRGMLEYFAFENHDFTSDGWVSIYDIDSVIDELKKTASIPQMKMLKEFDFEGLKKIFEDEEEIRIQKDLDDAKIAFDDKKRDYEKMKNKMELFKNKKTKKTIE